MNTPATYSRPFFASIFYGIAYLVIFAGLFGLTAMALEYGTKDGWQTAFIVVLFPLPDLDCVCRIHPRDRRPDRPRGPARVRHPPHGRCNRVARGQKVAVEKAA